MTFRPGDTYNRKIPLSEEGVSVTATVERDSGSGFVAESDTGITSVVNGQICTVSLSIPSGWAAGDFIRIILTATLEDETSYEVLEFRLESKTLSELSTQSSVDALPAAVHTALPELAKLDVPGTLANTDNADSFKADVSELAKTAELATATGEIIGAIGDIEGGGVSEEDKNELLRAAGLIQTPVNPAVSPALDVGEIAFRRGDTFTRTLELAASAADYNKLWMTFKRDVTQPDVKAALQFIAGEGLKILNGAEATGGDGEITLADDGVTLTINLDESVTAQISSGNAGAKWDVQMLKDGAVTTIAEGTWKVIADVTRATE